MEPFGKAELPVTERQGLMESYELSDITSDQLELFITRRYIDDATRAKLEKLITLRQQINLQTSKLNAYNEEVKRIADDQKRLRENIESLSKTAEAKTLIARYIAKAGEQETRLEEMEKERKAIAAEKERLERQLSVEIVTFEIK